MSAQPSAAPPANAAAHACDVAIVGAGPSGLAAASVLRQHGLDIHLIDEQLRAGGQILRQPPASFAVANWLQAKLYRGAKAVLHSTEGSADVRWRLGCTVLGIMRASEYRTLDASSSSLCSSMRRSSMPGSLAAVSSAPGAPIPGSSPLGSPPLGSSLLGSAISHSSNERAGYELWLQDPSGCATLRARAVLIAPGCYERPLAFPGWTLPGVMGAGAIQGFLKSQQFVPGDRFVLAGSHPLQLVVADQLLAAGANVAAVVFTQRPSRAGALLRRPLAMLGNTSALAESAKILWRLKRAGVAVKLGMTVVRAEGEESLQRVTIAALQRDGSIERGTQETLACDRLGVCHGFLASSELARQAGVRTRWREHEGGWLAEHDEWFESSLPGLFVAGEITGVAGADAALEKGRIAGLGVLRALGRLEHGEAERRAGPARRRLRRIDRFAQALNLLARPPERLASETMTDDTLLCRCESIACGEFRQHLQEHPHVASADAAKLLTRVGMGMCQGRLCGDNAAQLIALHRGVDRTEVGIFQAQAPVKPARLDLLCPPG